MPHARRPWTGARSSKADNGVAVSVGFGLAEVVATPGVGVDVGAGVLPHADSAEPATTTVATSARRCRVTRDPMICVLPETVRRQTRI
ncbi:hypothetical protein GCM10028801_30050 [Nocardioides maradonensis]